MKQAQCLYSDVSVSGFSLHVFACKMQFLPACTATYYASASVCLCGSTFCTDVLSSARQVARFLAHWPSCMAAAWSVTVGTDDLAEVTILLPGCRVEKEKQSLLTLRKCAIKIIFPFQDLPGKLNVAPGNNKGAKVKLCAGICGNPKLLHQLWKCNWGTKHIIPLLL